MATRKQLPPKVTGLSPKEGVPGTKVTIRGENLGTCREDLLGLIICGVDCTIFAEWESPSKIRARSPKCKGIGDVIVATRSGGMGSCTVQFRGYEDVISLSKESAVWVNEDDIITTSPTSRHRAASSPPRPVPDPLGFDRISPKDEELQTSNIPGSTNITSADFSPAKYLNEKHSNIGFIELKVGLNNLRKAMSDMRETPGSSSNPVTFLKPNVLAVVECLDALKSVNVSLKKDKQEFGSELTLRVDDIITHSCNDATSIFSGILSKKDQADSTRNALNVLQRYRFLFNLPSVIERNIQKGDYDVVINDYHRAKALFDQTEVKVFKRVYEEVETRINDLKILLREKLMALSTLSEGRNLDEVKKLIRYLVQLTVPYDPAWEAIITMKETLVTNLNECRERHLNLAIERKDEEQSPDRPQTVLFSEETIAIFNSFYPDLMKLGHDYLSGNISSTETTDKLKLKESTFEIDMMQDLIRHLVQLLRAALLNNTSASLSSSGGSRDNRDNQSEWPPERTDPMAACLPHCLRTIIDCYQSLIRQEMILTSNAMKPVQQLIFDFRVHSLNFLFGQLSDEIKVMSIRENWEVTFDNHLGTHTQLPLIFESRLFEVLQLVKETVLQTSNADEVEIFSQINVQGQMKQLAQTVLQSFLSTLEKTEKDDPNHPYKCHFTPDERILIVMSNGIFTTHHVFPRIQETFEKYNYPDMSAVIKVAQNKFKQVENKLLKKYTERKRDTLIGSIEPSMYSVNQEWYLPKGRPAEVSFYVKETIMSLVEIQCQVFSFAPQMVRKVITVVIDSAIEEVTRLHECVSDRFNENGNIQAVLDLAAMQFTFKDVDSETTDKLMEQTAQHLRPVQGSDRENVNRVLNQFKQSMQLQLYCFKWESDQTLIVI